MFNRRTILAGALTTSALSLSACGFKDRPLSAADALPDGYPTVEAVKYFAKRASELTNGAIQVKSFAGGQLGEEKSTLELCIFGGIDFNRVNMAPLNSIAPLTRVPALPFLFHSIDHMRRSMDGAPGKKILSSLEPYGLIGLCFYDSGARSFYNVKRPIHTPSDMHGLKIRVQNSDIFVAMVDALGANPTPMPYGEVYQSLVQGVVDGAENNWPAFESSRHFEVAKYYSLTRHVMAPEILVMSKRSWVKLSNDHKDAIRQAALDSVPVMRKMWDTRVSEAQKKIISSGVNVVSDIDTHAFSKRMAPVWAPIVDNDPDAKNLVSAIKALEG